MRNIFGNDLFCQMFLKVGNVLYPLKEYALATIKLNQIESYYENLPQLREKNYTFRIIDPSFRVRRRAMACNVVNVLISFKFLIIFFVSKRNTRL